MMKGAQDSHWDPSQLGAKLLIGSASGKVPFSESLFGKVRVGLTKQSNFPSKNGRIARKHCGRTGNHNPRVGGSSPSSGIVVSARKLGDGGGLHAA